MVGALVLRLGATAFRWDRDLDWIRIHHTYVCMVLTGGTLVANMGADKRKKEDK